MDYYFYCLRWKSTVVAVALGKLVALLRCDMKMSRFRLRLVLGTSLSGEAETSSSDAKNQKEADWALLYRGMVTSTVLDSKLTMRHQIAEREREREGGGVWLVEGGAPPAKCLWVDLSETTLVVIAAIFPRTIRRDRSRHELDISTTTKI